MITFKTFMENNSSKVFYHVTTQENYHKIMQHGLVPNVGARSAKLEEQPQIFLFTDKESMEDAVANWLGDEFDEDKELVVLQVSLPQDFPIQVNGGEATTTTPIPAKYIQLTNIQV